MAIKNLVTLGIGCSPGSTKYLLLVGLGIGAEVGLIDVALTDAVVTPLMLSDTAVAALVLTNLAVTALVLDDATRS